MKNFLAYALLLALPLLSNCKKDADLIDCETETENGGVLTATLTKHAVPVQQFTVTPNTAAVVRTATGSTIYVPASLVRPDGRPLSGSLVEVQVQEVTKRSEMIFTNTPTISGGQLLESGGMFNIAFQQDGQKLRLSRNSLVVRTTTPTALSTTNNMLLFLGLPDSVNRAQVGAWSQINTQTQQDSSRIFPVMGPIGNSTVVGFQVNLSPNIYNVNLGLLNWINCDRFVTATTRTTVQINVARQTVTNATTRSFLAFNNLNSVLSAYLGGATSNTFYASAIPVGQSVTAVVLHQEGTQLYFGKQTATIAANQQFSPTLRPVTEAELAAEINAL
jgi:outer membrane protein assembly factor BamB